MLFSIITLLSFLFFSSNSYASNFSIKPTPSVRPHIHSCLKQLTGSLQHLIHFSPPNTKIEIGSMAELQLLIQKVAGHPDRKTIEFMNQATSVVFSKAADKPVTVSYVMEQASKFFTQTEVKNKFLVSVLSPNVALIDNAPGARLVFQKQSPPYFRRVSLSQWQVVTSISEGKTHEKPIKISQPSWDSFWLLTHFRSLKNWEDTALWKSNFVSLISYAASVDLIQRWVVAAANIDVHGFRYQEKLISVDAEVRGLLKKIINSTKGIVWIREKDTLYIRDEYFRLLTDGIAFDMQMYVESLFIPPQNRDSFMTSQKNLFFQKLKEQTPLNIFYGILGGDSVSPENYQQRLENWIKSMQSVISLDPHNHSN